jgi:hypothetical protein
LAEEAVKELSTEELNVLKEAENAENVESIFIEANKVAEDVFQEVVDEVCSDD